MVIQQSFKLAAAIVLSTLILPASTALAADVSDVEALPEEPADESGWSGFYIGGTVSGVFVFSDYIQPAAPDAELDGEGMMGGVFGGFSYQTGNVAFGVEADLMYGDVDTGNVLGGVQQDINYISTIRGRVGVAPGSTFAYVTGGIAFAESEVTLTGLGESDSNHHTGFAVGGGLEHSWTDNFVSRIDYLYASFDDKSYNFTSGPLTTGIDDVHMVRASVGWWF